MLHGVSKDGLNNVGTSGRSAAVSNADLRDLPNRRRRWYLGIQSKKEPSHVMNEVYKAMMALQCIWHQVNNYRVLCLWNYTPGLGFEDTFVNETHETDKSMSSHSVC
jgi:hypothetical protein